MKKAPFFAGVVVGIVLTLIVGFVCALPHIKFLDCTIVDTPVERRLDHFGYYKGVPEGSSQHYFYRDGFTDTDEFWSFKLPPDQMEGFIRDYVSRHRIPKASEKLPSAVTRALRPSFQKCEKWEAEYWFEDFADLDAMYAETAEGGIGEFAAYSKKNGRVYLMNWNR